MLADELPHGRLLEAESIVELRFSPDRLTGEIADFIDELLAAPAHRGADRGPAPGRWLSCPAMSSRQEEKAAPPRGAPG